MLFGASSFIITTIISIILVIVIGTIFIFTSSFFSGLVSTLYPSPIGQWLKDCNGTTVSSFYRSVVLSMFFFFFFSLVYRSRRFSHPISSNPFVLWVAFSLPISSGLDRQNATAHCGPRSQAASPSSHIKEERPRERRETGKEEEEGWRSVPRSDRAKIYTR